MTNQSRSANRLVADEREQALAFLVDLGTFGPGEPAQRPGLKSAIRSEFPRKSASKGACHGPYDLVMISLRPIDESTREAVEALEVSPVQQRFVSNASDSIDEAAREPDGRALYWAIYADETPVGFVMISDEVGGPGYFPQYLWKLFIDRRYQGRGYGTATLDLVADYFRRRPKVTIMRTSCGQGEGSPLGFYEHYGFEQTGDIVFDSEILLQYKLR